MRAQLYVRHALIYMYTYAFIRILIQFCIHTDHTYIYILCTFDPGVDVSVHVHIAIEIEIEIEISITLTTGSTARPRTL
jgi:hypothetical protein